jgi:pimeloyl-ACP methyl ester carboxylesterase
VQTGFVEREGFRLHYAMSGRNHAPPLLLLHPLGANMDVWAPQLPQLDPYFRVIRYAILFSPDGTPNDTQEKFLATADPVIMYE